MYFVVRLKRGGPWDWSRDLREQVGWVEHADCMDSLVDDGFIVLGGMLTITSIEPWTILLDGRGGS